MMPNTTVAVSNLVNAITYDFGVSRGTAIFLLVAGDLILTSLAFGTVAALLTAVL